MLKSIISKNAPIATNTSSHSIIDSDSHGHGNSQSGDHDNHDSSVAHGTVAAAIGADVPASTTSGHGASSTIKRITTGHIPIVIEIIATWTYCLMMIYYIALDTWRYVHISYIYHNTHHIHLRTHSHARLSV
jgi:hypothetical protein